MAETIEFRDRLVERLGCELIVQRVQDSIDAGRAQEEEGPNPSRNFLQIVTLLDAIKELKIDAALGGGRRDEEKARAKERFFSHRDEFGQWDPKNQRPELWNIFNGRKNVGENFRVFPLSNWTETDVWQYIEQEEIEIPSLYFTHQREVVDRDGTLLANTEFNTLLPGEAYESKQVRFRHDRGRHVHRRHAFGRLPRSRRSSWKSPRLAPPSGAGGTTTRGPKPQWKTVRSRGISDGAGVLLMAQGYF